MRLLPVVAWLSYPVAATLELRGAAPDPDPAAAPAAGLGGPPVGPLLFRAGLAEDVIPEDPDSARTNGLIAKPYLGYAPSGRAQAQVCGISQSTVAY